MEPTLWFAGLTTSSVVVKSFLPFTHPEIKLLQSTKTAVYEIQPGNYLIIPITIADRFIQLRIDNSNQLLK
jgi:hypothetical protein